MFFLVLLDPPKGVKPANGQRIAGHYGYNGLNKSEFFHLGKMITTGLSVKGGNHAAF